MASGEHLTIAVVYLARGRDVAGFASVQKFFESYDRFPAGAEHQLYVLAKGWDSADELKAVTEICRARNGKLIELPDDGYDWGAYFRSIDQISEDLVCFLNTHSRIRVGSWLKFLSTPIVESSDVGIVGSTASYQSMAPSYRLVWPSTILTLKLRGIFWAAIKLIRGHLAFLVRGHKLCMFPSFPNPHVRSNAFITRRVLFGQYKEKKGIPRTKQNTYAMESGRGSYTKFLIQKNLRALIVNEDGNVFDCPDWVKSSIFRPPYKHIIADNRTTYVESQPTVFKRLSEVVIWGKVFEGEEYDA